MFVGVIFAASGLLLIGLAIPLIQRRVPPNGIYGLRVPATFADDEVWYEANERSGRELLALGVTLLVLAVILPLTGLREDTVALVLAATTSIGALVMLAVGWSRANRLLAEAERSREEGETPG